MTVTLPASALRIDDHVLRFDAAHDRKADGEQTVWVNRAKVLEPVAVAADENCDWDQFRGYF
jgi:hypothetical protein